MSMVSWEMWSGGLSFVVCDWIWELEIGFFVILGCIWGVAAFLSFSISFSVWSFSKLLDSTLSEWICRILSWFCETRKLSFVVLSSVSH
jgi:hypothetical protein